MAFSPKSKKKKCYFHDGKSFTEDHFVSYKTSTGRIIWICKENYEANGNKWLKGSKKGKSQPRTKYFDYERGSEEYKKNAYLIYTYGINLKEYNEMINEQNGCCAICGRHQLELFNTLAVDHCHITGKVRGLLCMDCNVGIGKLKDDIDLLKKSIDYLSKYKNN